MLQITEVPFCWLTAAAAEVLCRRRAAMARVNSNAIAMTHSTEEVGHCIRVWHASSNIPCV